MRTAARGEWRLHFNSDLSGTAVLGREDGDLPVRVGVGGIVLHAECFIDSCQVEFPAELLLELQARALESAADELFPGHLATPSRLRARAAELRKR